MKKLTTFAESVAALELASAEFYGKQASMTRNQNTRNILGSIAEEEVRHALFLSSMAGDPALSTALEKAAFNSGPILGPLIALDEGMERRITFSGTERDIFDLALALERESLLFYKALFDAIEPRAIKAVIRDLFAKERDHFGRIRDLRASWRPLTLLEDRIEMQAYLVADGERMY